MTYPAPTSVHLLWDNDHVCVQDAAEYEALAVRLGKDSKLYRVTREAIVKTCLARNPRNPYWDLQRYAAGEWCRGLCGLI